MTIIISRGGYRAGTAARALHDLTGRRLRAYLRSAIEECRLEAVRQGYSGDEWQMTAEDERYICEELGRTPSREEWQDALR